jgi:hypothetical protein
MFRNNFLNNLRREVSPHSPPGSALLVRYSWINPHAIRNKHRSLRLRTALSISAMLVMLWSAVAAH